MDRSDARMPARVRRRSLKALVLLVLLCVFTVGFGASTLLTGFVALRLGSVERLELADSLSAAPLPPLTAADVVAGVGADGVEARNGSAAAGRSARSASDSVDPGAADANSDGFVGSGPPGGDAPLRPPALLPRDRAENYLLVGTDSIAGLDPDDPIVQGRSRWSQLADVIMVVRLRQDGTAALLSVPRDLLVEIAGVGRMGKINSAFNGSGTAVERAARLIDTIETQLGFTLQHFLQVDFAGFRRLIDAFGGVEMTFDRPLRDRTPQDSGDPSKGGSGFAVPAGRVLLDGEAALAYVRSRHLLVQDSDGAWVPYEPWNDFARSERQRDLLLLAAHQAKDRLAANPAGLLELLDIAADSVTTSDTLSIVQDGTRLLSEFRDMDPLRDVKEYTLQTRDDRQPGQWSLRLEDNAANRTVLDVFRGIEPDDVIEWRVSVAVSGAAADRVAARLRQLDFSVTTSGPQPSPAIARSAPPPTDASPRATVAYGPQGQLAAALLASHLRPLPAFAPDPALGANEVALHLWGDPPDVVAEHQAVELPPAVPAP